MRVFIDRLFNWFDNLWNTWLRAWWGRSFCVTRHIFQLNRSRFLSFVWRRPLHFAEWSESSAKILFLNKHQVQKSFCFVLVTEIWLRLNQCTLDAAGFYFSYTSLSKLAPINDLSLTCQPCCVHLGFCPLKTITSPIVPQQFSHRKSVVGFCKCLPKLRFYARFQIDSFFNYGCPVHSNSFRWLSVVKTNHFLI